MGPWSWAGLGALGAIVLEAILNASARSAALLAPRFEASQVSGLAQPYGAQGQAYAVAQPPAAFSPGINSVYFLHNVDGSFVILRVVKLGGVANTVTGSVVASTDATYPASWNLNNVPNTLLWAN